MKTDPTLEPSFISVHNPYGNDIELLGPLSVFAGVLDLPPGVLQRSPSSAILDLRDLRFGVARTLGENPDNFVRIQSMKCLAEQLESGTITTFPAHMAVGGTIRIPSDRNTTG